MRDIPNGLEGASKSSALFSVMILFFHCYCLYSTLPVTFLPYLSVSFVILADSLSRVPDPRIAPQKRPITIHVDGTLLMATVAAAAAAADGGGGCDDGDIRTDWTDSGSDWFHIHIRSQVHFNCCEFYACG